MDWGSGKKLLQMVIVVGGKTPHTSPTKFIKANACKCEAVENEDFEVFNNSVKNSKGGRPTTEYIIQLDTAKEMAMLERNEVGS